MSDYAKRVASVFSLASMALRIAERRFSYISEEDGEYCVKSKKNPDWSGGCYETKAEAEDRLSQVEMFKHMKGGKEGKGRRSGAGDLPWEPEDQPWEPYDHDPPHEEFEEQKQRYEDELSRTTGKFLVFFEEDGRPGVSISDNLYDAKQSARSRGEPIRELSPSYSPGEFEEGTYSRDELSADDEFWDKDAHPVSRMASGVTFKSAPEYASIEAFVQHMMDDENEEYDHEDLKALNYRLHKPLHEIRAELGSYGLKLKERKPVKKPRGVMDNPHDRWYGPGSDPTHGGSGFSPEFG